MRKTRKIQRLLVQAMYGDLDGAERRRLDEYLDSSPEARGEFEALKALVDAIPREQPKLGCDLLPLVRAHLEEKARFWPVPAWGLAVAAMVCLALIGAVSLHLWRAESGKLAAGATPQPISPVLDILREAAALMAQRDYANAHRALTTAVECYPEDRYAGYAQQELAQLYFEQFHGYKEAYEAYLALKRDYPETFEADPENANRLDLLDESRRVSFASLELLDAARGRRGESFAALEEVVARYPTTQVAALAMDEMVRRVLDSISGEKVTPVQVLEEARDRCRDAVAVAQFNIRIANAYWRDLDDASTARELFQRALDTDEPGVAELARGFLEKIEGTASR